MIRREIKTMGSSLFIIIPKSLAELLDVVGGSQVEIDYKDGKVIISNPKKTPAPCSPQPVGEA